MSELLEETVPDKISVEDLQDLIDRSPFNRFCQVAVERLDHDALSLVLRMPMRPEFERRARTGQWHGGPIAALIDTAGDYALVLHVGAAVPTINYRTDYLRPAVDTDLLATARVRRAGRTVGVVDVDISDEAGKLIAVGRGCYGTQAG